MNKLLALILLVAAASAQASVSTVAYIRGDGDLWDPEGGQANLEALDDAFGPGGYEQLTMSGAGATPFEGGSPYLFIYLEGGDGSALELAAYLAANLPAIESWVSNGGNLFLNSAPNEGGNIDFGFGGVTLNYPGAGKAAGHSAGDSEKGGPFQACSAAFLLPTHPILNGAFQPSGTDYTGDGFCHAYVTGGDILPAIELAGGGPENGQLALAEKRVGSGCVMFGGMTTDNFHDPRPQAQNLTRNILQYGASESCGSGGSNYTVPALSRGGFVLFVLLTLLLGGSVLYRRRRIVR